MSVIMFYRDPDDRRNRYHRKSASGAVPPHDYDSYRDSLREAALVTYSFTPEPYSFPAALLDMKPAVVILQKSQCRHPTPQAFS